ncbi:MAG: DUF3489 domain-containing protein [Alphaproteobacteria bacterium]|nr:DUF3489 domain-containing protein [Alphaproteobacteria bacterium]
MTSRSTKLRVSRAKKAPAKSKSVGRAARSTVPAGAATKLDTLIKALQSPKGATLARLVDLTGWQAHSVRGALSGALKKKRGLTIISTTTEGERVYRIKAGA